MLFAKSNDVPPEISKIRFGRLDTIKGARQFAIKGLLGDITTCIEWVEGVGETIVNRRQARNLFRDPQTLAMQVRQPQASIPKIENAIVKNSRPAVWMGLAKFVQPGREEVANFGHRVPPASDRVQILLLADTKRHDPID